MTTYQQFDAQRTALIDRLAGKPGFRGRLDAKCAECIYDPASAGTWRKQVENCTDRACPLWDIRPTSEGEA